MTVFWLSVEIVASKGWANFQPSPSLQLPNTDDSTSFLKTPRKGDCMIFLGNPIINIFARNSPLSPKYSCCIFSYSPLFFFFLNCLTSPANFASQIPLQSLTCFLFCFFQNSIPFWSSQCHKRSLSKMEPLPFIPLLKIL